MKCHKCGHWNRETFPRCFKCGTLLAGGEADMSWTSGFQARKAPKLVTRFDSPDAGDESTRPPLAAEMNELKQRRTRGEARLAALRQSVPGGQPGAGYAYGSSARVARGALALNEDYEAEGGEARDSGLGLVIEEITPIADMEERYEAVQTAPPLARRGGRYELSRTAGTPTDPRPTRMFSARQEQERPDVADALVSRARKTQRAVLEPDMLEEEAFTRLPRVIDLDMPPAETETHAIAVIQTRPVKRVPMRGAFAAAVWMLRLLIVSAVAVVGFLAATQFVAPWLRASGAKDIPYIVEAAIVQDLPGHVIRIPGEEGDKIVVRELAHTYTVVNGYATISVPDYRFYENIPNLSAERLTVTLTPSLDGSQPMPPITFEVEIPESPLKRVQPKSEWSQVSTAVGTIQLNVTPGSKVVINGVDWSDAMDDNGTLTVAQPVQPIGDNEIMISVTAPHMRTRNETIKFYRAPMEVPVELKEDTGSRSSVSNKNVSEPARDGENYFLINAITIEGAAVTIDTPHKNLKVDPTGAFSFMPVFDKIGDNVVRIRASYPGKEDSVLEYTVYYMPPSSEYSRKAWALAPSDYRELLANIERRIGQIYLCQGRIIRIVSTAPQLAIMDTGKNGAEQLVMLENKTLDTWKEGDAYKVYADVSGLYDTMPRLYGRYCYPQE